MQATTRVHDSVPKAILQETDLVLHDPVAFHPANGMFNPDADGRELTIRRLLRGCEFPTTRFLLGLDNRDAVQDESLEAPLLRETTSGGQALTLKISQACIVGLAFRGGTQEAHLTGLIDHEAVFARVAFLLATVVFLRLFRICRTVDWPFSTIMPQRGGVVLSLVCWLGRSIANSPAV
jgi:hypothetical protein